MIYSTLDLQARCAALGFPPGPIDGLRGPRTRAAVTAACEARGVRDESGLFHASGLHRIHWHWTAGAYGVIDLERDHYHFLVDETPALVVGNYAPEANADTSDDHYAAHTWYANSGAIGIAIDAMAGAREAPFERGSAPMTTAQLDVLTTKTAELCRVYDIPVSRWSTLSHAEVQPTLGVRQRMKWDITWIPGMQRPGDPIDVGNRIRAVVSGKLAAGACAA